MGYLSDVVLGIPKTTKTKALLFDKPLPCPENFDEVVTSNNGAIEYYKAYSLKWYPTYAEVRECEEFMNFCDDKGLPYGFIRIGEDMDDVETQGNPYSLDMYVVRSIATE